MTVTVRWTKSQLGSCPERADKRTDLGCPVDAAGGKVEVVQLLMIVEAVAAIARAAATRIPESTVTKVSSVDGAGKVVDRHAVRAAVLFLHGARLDVVGELGRRHPVRFFPVGLQLGRPELGLCKRSGRVGDLLVWPGCERSKTVNVGVAVHVGHGCVRAAAAADDHIAHG